MSTSYRYTMAHRFVLGPSPLPAPAQPCTSLRTRPYCMQAVQCLGTGTRSGDTATQEPDCSGSIRSSAPVPRVRSAAHRASVRTVAGYYWPKDWDGPVYAKAGLMPRWSRDGRFVAFDSAHVWGTGSQMYVAGVQQMKVGWQQTAAARAPTARSVSCWNHL